MVFRIENDGITSATKETSRAVSNTAGNRHIFLADAYDHRPTDLHQASAIGGAALNANAKSRENKINPVTFKGASTTGINLNAIEKFAADYSNPNPQLDALFKNALPDAAHQSEVRPDGTVFVKTGDIPFEWYRDSAAEVTPYLYFAKDPQVGNYIKGVVEGQAKALKLHPYDAAFDKNYNVTWDRFELDSLLYPIELAWRYWKITGDKTIYSNDVKNGFDKALETMLVEQNHNKESKYTNEHLDQKPNGNPGMIWSGFRASDGDMVYHYSIPENMMASFVLKELAEIESDVNDDQAKADASLKLASQVDEGIKNYGIVDSKDFGKVYAYEVDGLGHSVLMDDANLPSLLAAPYMGYLPASDPIYQNTRRMLLSSANPNYYSGRLASGIGCGNTAPGTIWPLSLLAQGLTATNQNERDLMLKYLLASDPGDHYLHESFDANDQRKLTRNDFVWPNSLFAEYILADYMGYGSLPHAR
jgi:meiotically up-regulated gene 157 (Mug157) protein